MAWYGGDYRSPRGEGWMGRDYRSAGHGERPFAGPRYDRGWRDRDRVRFHEGGRDWNDRLREGWRDLKQGVREAFGSDHDHGYHRRGSYSGRYHSRDYGRGWW